MLIRILSKLGLITGIWLEDWKGNLYYTKLKKNPSGLKWAYSYPFTHISRWVLNNDGSIDRKKSEYTFMEKWGYIYHHE